MNRPVDSSPLRHRDRFQDRHIGPRDGDLQVMLEVVGVASLEELADRCVPDSIRSRRSLEIGEGQTEQQTLAELLDLSERNQQFRSFIGMGYSDCVTPPAIQRGILENPGWYTAYTPYQPEISQGRLEALLNFQTMISDLTGFEIANASLLDEGTAAAEAMTFCHRVLSRKLKDDVGNLFFISEACHPQTIEVVQARARPLGIEVQVGDHEDFTFPGRCFGCLLQYPDTNGRVFDPEGFCDRAHAVGAMVVVAADLLSLTILRPPGEFGADVAIGSSQRFGIPMGFGGPHAAYLATHGDYRRNLPGRLVGVSHDTEGKPALRLALQTREQHIRRDRATSNICTSQVLLAVCAGMFGVYHGPEGLQQIARRVHALTIVLRNALLALGHDVCGGEVFDTLRVKLAESGADSVVKKGLENSINLRRFEGGDLGVSLDQRTTVDDLLDLYQIFGGDSSAIDFDSLACDSDFEYPRGIARDSEFMTHPVFHQHRSETDLMRYMHHLESKDLSLNTAMIPLGSCTMKLNAAAEMFPFLYPGFARLHPFVPTEQTAGYQELFSRLEAWLCEITGFSAISMMPNAGSQGEYAGLVVIRAYHLQRGEAHRRVCFIPKSSHGTNPASAKMAGMEVVVIGSDRRGNIDLDDLREKISAHGENLSALMVTYPSTHGVFETSISEVCDLIHEAGGQVYLDGANMNAMVGLCRPGKFGADVCHLNLHKTFCIPHGGGGPGMGPIGVARHLVDFLPCHPVVETGGSSGIGAISAAPFGSPTIVPISYAYIAMMGSEGLRRASLVAILNANYIASRLAPEYPILFTGENGLVAHECILDTRRFSRTARVTVDDIAKRLIDFGFHAPTMSWPVAGTLMVEPTESEPKGELDRFCEAMLQIAVEIREIEEGHTPYEKSPLHNAPHTASAIAASNWDRPYSRERGAFPTEATRQHKFWPAVARIDQAFGDRNLICSCLPVESYTD
ncbi:MAG TPA: aminomethyl-transferring glycine dehydrogenase [Planctomycetes bacterium]|nr:aminomethyl-transferring glycine dehydrogenase [Planctomycetota bacterium]HIN80144.1 glycine dehydrogenase (aminomethyl-transferring) [Planctomycetota bacterium]